ncbi:nitrite/sulfite reductase [Leeia sp. TBRC 13508]|uniref:Nitrite/sulfite reductase n=1 Tax=Leeia speluncae TaxID=2884804 RepID=A0ABS8D810_9NEIS|nr:nitrite/sulfite reductase [Leeia speluncae]MCB6184351.1 nitrite/sulfite reductase [Leeia speluncae]
MYIYDEIDQQLIDDRVRQFRDQTNRYLAGELSEDDFRPLRLQNGLYVQRHAPMLRVAVPYGVLNSKQVRKLAHIARTYDRGYGHFTTRQNIQYNWPDLAKVPDILEELATVQMHAIQTSGNCVRNFTADQFAGVAADEVIDPRPYAEIMRQWFTFHPEFAYLPRKFKMALSGSTGDRAAIYVHDIGVQLYPAADGTVLADVIVGGGLGRTPIVGSVIKKGLPWFDLLTYCDAVLRVYNRFGRRDNKYKARIKILVKALGPDTFGDMVDEEWKYLKDGPGRIPQAEFDRVNAHFQPKPYESFAGNDASFEAKKAENPAFARWVSRNVHPHKRAGYSAITFSLKGLGFAPGDITDAQLDKVADLADQYSFGEIRVSHEQNLILTDVKQSDLFALWEAAKELKLANPNIGLLTNMIACPGGDFCALANAKSIPIAEGIAQRFEDLDYLFDIGELDLNISGCMNSCGHHHIGHIGILGVDKNGSEWYQISLGGNQGMSAKGTPTSLGKVIGPSFAQDEVPAVIEKIIQTYLALRQDDERFIDSVQRLGIEPFKERVYAKAN